MMLSEKAFKQALAILFSVHKQLQPESDKGFICKAWYRMLRDIPDEKLLDAVTRFVVETPKLYPGDNFIAIIRQLASPTLQETEGDAIELAFEAVRRFGYMREDEAMQWLQSKSPLIAAVVRRIGYLDLCQSDNPDVIRGQLRAIFKAEKERARQVGGIVETATHLDRGQHDEARLIGLAKKVGGQLRALPAA